jgi:hypothetical protein
VAIRDFAGFKKKDIGNEALSPASSIFSPSCSGKFLLSSQPNVFSPSFSREQRVIMKKERMKQSEGKKDMRDACALSSLLSRSSSYRWL